MTNVGRSRSLIEQLHAARADEFCVCAGSRNSPLLAVLGASDLKLYSFFDERSAAFFALGRSKQHGRPVVVVTTSGTAVAELLPATIEAHYSGVPLVLLTADRPARFRGTGAPQCIEQDGIFGPYAATDLASWDGARPLHINIEFDEPLIDAVAEPLSLRVSRQVSRKAPSREAAHAAAHIPFQKPLVILGPLAVQDRDRVAQFAAALGAPVYAEPLSGLREDPRLAAFAIRAGERMIPHGNFDGVIRIGGVPTLRFWRDLEESSAHLPVVSFASTSFSGLTRGERHSLVQLPSVEPRERNEAFFRLDRERAAAIDRLLAEEPESEPALFRRTSLEMVAGARIYLGNSLPIREWDLFAARDARSFVVEGNRGANGIDGQLSTFFGWCAEEAENVAVLGDLTAMYDLNAPWIGPQLGAAVHFKVIVINNGGGRIFSRVPSLRTMDPAVRERIVENSHDVSLEHWAAMWNLPYGDPAAARSILELRPDAAATMRFWERYDSIW